MTTATRIIRAPRGTSLTCKGWPQEAALRMLMNNLDPDVAEQPDELVVYGGSGKAARSWPAFDAIVRSLTALEHDETGAAETEQADQGGEARGHAEAGAGRGLGRRGAQIARHSGKCRETQQGVDQGTGLGTGADLLLAVSSDDKGTPQGSRCRPRQRACRTAGPARSRAGTRRRCRGSGPSGWPACRRRPWRCRCSRR